MRVLRGLSAAAVLLAVGTVRTTPAEAAGDDAGTPVTVATKDGMKLAATRWDAPAAGAAGVVLLHMEKSDRSAWAPLVPHLRSRGLAVLAVDLRGCGGSAKQSTGGLLPQRFEKRDPRLFAGMFEDAIAAVRHLAKDGRCDAKRIAVVGAGVGGAVAFDAARRFPKEIAAVLWLTPVADHPGLDSVEQAKSLPPEEPLLLLAHEKDRASGAQAIHDALPKSSLLVYDDAAPASAASDGDAWARGTRMLGRLPLVEQTIASFAAARTGSKRDDVVLDGVVEDEGADGGTWTRAASVATELSTKAWAYRVGRRVEFGGRVGPKVLAVRLGMDTHFPPGTAPYVSSDPKSGLPEIAAIDLAKGVVAWAEPHDSGAEAGSGAYATRVRPVVRVVRTADGFSFEGEWISDYGDGPKGPVDPAMVRVAITAAGAVPPRPEKFAPGAVKIEIDWVDAAVEATPR